MMLKHLKMGKVRYRSVVILAILFLISLTVACSQPQQQPEPTAESPAKSQIEENKKIAVAFFNMILNEHKVAEAFEKYSVPDYIQHNPYAATGAQPAIDFFTPYYAQNPGACAEIKRVIAEGDLVTIHNNSKQNPDDRGSAVVDIFRIENGRVVEHWDVVQQIPEKSMNQNTMF